MIVGIGTDIISIEKIKDIMLRRGDRFLNRIFTPAERAYCEGKKFPWIHFAGRFAAKESVFKILQADKNVSVKWQEIEVLPQSNGKPFIVLKGTTKLTAKEKGIKKILVSISHDSHYATATAIGESIE